jgi:signal transduction histidine kinase
VLFRYENGMFRAAATLNAPQAFVEFHRERGSFKPPAGTPLDRLLKAGGAIYSADEATNPGAPARLGGARSLVTVPMRKDGQLIGAIIIYRQEVRPFTDKQIELLTNFAAQAVIAIENTRLLNELRESLQQQTATSEVLQTISSSQGDLQPVFNAMLGNATRICEAKFGVLFLYEGDAFRVIALHGAPPAYAEERRRDPRIGIPHGTAMARMVETRQTVQIADIQSEPAYFNDPQRRAGLIGSADARTLIMVPMLKEEELIGAISIHRQEVRAFTDKQIELVTNFASQAVIAIENSRLLNELRQRTHDLTQSLEDLRATQDRLVQTQKLALLGQLTAGIAHEIKNPLNFVNNFSGISAELIDELQVTLKGIPLDDKARAEIEELADTLKGNFDKVVHHGRRADAIVKNMLQHSREGSGEHRVIDVNALVEESLNLAWHGARAETKGFEIKLKQSFDPSAGEADVFPQDIRRALLNVISNGFYAATKRRAETDGADYEPTLTASTKNLGDRVEIRIGDNGSGMTPEVKEKMFNPFFTTKPTGEGTGLGLSISHDIIVKQHGGSIEVETRPGEFTEIRVILPRAAVFV